MFSWISTSFWLMTDIHSVYSYDLYLVGYTEKSQNLQSSQVKAFLHTKLWMQYPAKCIVQQTSIIWVVGNWSKCHIKAYQCNSVWNDQKLLFEYNYVVVIVCALAAVIVCNYLFMSGNYPLSIVCVMRMST